MENEKNVAEVEMDETNVEQETKPGVGERILESKPVKGIRKHWKGLVAGTAAAGAVIAAGVMAAKAAAEGAAEAPFDVEAVKDAIPKPEIAD